MESKKSLTLNGLVLPNFFYVLVSVAMIFVGVYLTNHFFNTFYPEGLANPSSLCNISNFWGCDKATNSPLGTIAGMPTSIFGIIMGIIGLFAAFIGSPAVEKTVKTITLLNLVACALLFVYSLAILKSLCPMCTAYYVLSLLAFLLFYRYSDSPMGFDPKITSGFAALVIIPTIILNFYIGEKKEKKAKLGKSYIAQYNDLKDYGDPAVESPYKIHKATQKFEDAPIRITVFSDFQCPYCQAVAEQMPSLIRDFKSKINIQYMFYPLDMACNTKMKGGMHAYACKAAYLAACDEDKFAEIHDYIFEKQSEINLNSLKSWGKKFGLPDNCSENKAIQDQIQQTLNAGEQYNLKSTPTIIINGKKLEGLVPTVHLKSILRSILKKQ
jgi:protein-disulfide isomerase/uncharacterized membrane protein